jgi:hypothetical protein
MDQQLAQVLEKMTQWLNLLTIISITGFVLVAGGIISSNIALHRLAQGLWLDLRRRHDRIDDDLAEIKRLLREQ